MFDRSKLTEKEFECILSVVMKDAEVRAQENRQINEIRQKLDEIASKSLSKTEEDTMVNSCTRCRDSSSRFVQIFRPFVKCPKCGRRVCCNCVRATPLGAKLCIYCATEQQLNALSGRWFESESEPPSDPSNDLLGTLLKCRIDAKMAGSGNSAVKGANFALTNVVGSFSANTFPPQLSKESAPTAHQPQTTVMAGGSASTSEAVAAATEPVLVAKDEAEELPTVESTAESQRRDSKSVSREEVVGNQSEAKCREETNEDPKSEPLSGPERTESAPGSASGDDTRCQPLEQLSVPEPNAKQPASAIEAPLEPESSKESTTDTPVATVTNVPGSSIGPPTHCSRGSAVSDVSVAAVLEKTPVSAHGLLSGQMKVEQVDGVYMIKLKIVEAIGLKPFDSNPVSSYVVCRANHCGNSVFKKKSSVVSDCSSPVWNEVFELTFSHNLNDLIIFLVVKKPQNKRLGNILKRRSSTPECGGVYGVVRIGAAGFLSQEETSVWKALEHKAAHNICEWTSFCVQLHRGEANSASDQTKPTYSEDSQTKTVNKDDDRGDIISYSSIASTVDGNETITGQLMIRMRYSEVSDHLWLTLENAQGLWLDSKADPTAKTFAKCRVVPQMPDNEEKTTVVSKNAVDPEWNSTFIFKVTSAMRDSSLVVVNIQRSEGIRRKGAVGQCLIPVGPMVEMFSSRIKDGVTRSLPVTRDTPNNSYGFKGVLHVSLRYDPISNDGCFGNLEARVLNAAHLQYDSKSGLIDSHVVCYLLPGTQKIDRRKSATVRKSANPVYKFHFSYQSLQLSDLRHNLCLEILVFHKRKKFIGGVRLCTRVSDTYSEPWQDSSDLETSVWQKMCDQHRTWITTELPLRYTMASQNTFPPLATYVHSLWTAAMLNSGVLHLSAAFDLSEGRFSIGIIALKNVQSNLLLTCRVKVYYVAESKSQKQFIQQTEHGQWDAAEVVFDTIGSLENAVIELRLQTLTYSQTKSKKTQNPIIGRVLLSSGDKEGFSGVSTQEADFFNCLLRQGNAKHVAELPLAPYSKPKIIGKKNYKKGLDPKRGSLIDLKSAKLRTKKKEHLQSSVDIGKGTMLARSKSKALNLFNKRNSRAVKSGAEGLAPTYGDRPKNKSVSTSGISEDTKPDTDPVSKPLQPTSLNDSGNFQVEPPINADDFVAKSCDSHDETNRIPDPNIGDNSLSGGSDVFERHPTTSDVAAPPESTLFISDNKEDACVAPVSVQTPGATSPNVKIEGETNAIGPENVASPRSWLDESKPIQDSSTQGSVLTHGKGGLSFLTTADQEAAVRPHILEAASTGPTTATTAEAVKISQEDHDVSLPLPGPSEQAEAVLQSNDSATQHDSFKRKIQHQLPSLVPTEDQYVPPKSETTPNASSEVGAINSVVPLTGTPEIAVNATDVDNENSFREAGRQEGPNDDDVKTKVTKTLESISDSTQSLNAPPEEKPTPSRPTDGQTQSTESADMSGAVTPTSFSDPKNLPTNKSEAPNDSSQSSHSSQPNSVSWSTTECTPSTQVSSQSHAPKKGGLMSKLKKASSLYRKQPAGKTPVVHDDSRVATESYLGYGELKPRSSMVAKRVDDDAVSMALSLYGSAIMQGELCVGLRYNRINQQLGITIKRATNLVAHDPKKGTNDAYVKVHVFPDKGRSSKFQTKVVKNSKTPVWNETFNYTTNEVDLSLRKLVVNVWHHSIGRKFFLGETVIGMKEVQTKLLQQGYVEANYPLDNRSNPVDLRIENDILAELVVGLMVEQINSVSKKKKVAVDSLLTVKVVEARNVAALEPVNHAICKVSFLHGKHRPIKKASKSAENKNGTFVWNFAASFEVDRAAIADCGFKLKIVDSKKKKRVVATLSLNNNSKTFTWQQASLTAAGIWMSLHSNNGHLEETTFSLPIADFREGSVTADL